jgi:hypothetical protein
MYNISMRLTVGRRLIGIVLLAFSLALLAWGLTKGKTLVRTVEITPQEMALAGIGDEGYQKARLIRLSWPAKLHAGDAGSLHLSFDLATQPGEESAATQPAEGAAQVDNQGLDQYHQIELQSHLDLPGVEFSPTGEVSQALLPGEKAVFLWNLRPREAGTYSGKVWLHLQSSPRATSPQSRMVLTAQRFEIEVEEFMGLNGTQARAIGSLGVVIGAFLSLDGAVNQLLRWIENRRQEG